VVFTEEEISRTGLDYLALGHWHSAVEGRAGMTSYAYSGAPEPVALDQDGAGQVLLVTLDDRDGYHNVIIEPKRVGETLMERVELDISTVESQPDLIDTIGRHADANLVLDVRLTGLYPDELDIDIDEVERALAASFLRLRVRDATIPAAPEGVAPPPDTVIGAFCAEVDERLAHLATSTAPDAADEAADLREVLRLGRHLLEGRQVTL
jgi:DNA repair exonuclease SbcCD nuclease subunit